MYVRTSTNEDFKKLNACLLLENRNKAKVYGVFFDDFRGLNDKKVI
jgi:hypothetical protein